MPYQPVHPSIHPRGAPVREASDRAPLENKVWTGLNRQRPAWESVTTERAPNPTAHLRSGLSNLEPVDELWARACFRMYRKRASRIAVRGCCRGKKTTPRGGGGGWRLASNPSPGRPYAATAAAAAAAVRVCFGGDGPSPYQVPPAKQLPLQPGNKTCDGTGFSGIFI